MLCCGVVTELRWDGRGNFSFMRHTYLVVTVKNGWNRCTFTEVIAKLKQGYHFLDYPVHISSVWNAQVKDNKYSLKSQTCRALSSRLFQGEYETVRGPSSGRRPRVEARSAERGRVWVWGVPLPRLGGPGGTPGKILKFETQSGAFWQEIDVSPAFHLCERKHCHSARQWYWHSNLLF